jgi:hypothetical protein
VPHCADRACRAAGRLQAHLWLYERGEGNAGGRSADRRAALGATESMMSLDDGKPAEQEVEQQAKIEQRKDDNSATGAC